MTAEEYELRIRAIRKQIRFLLWLTEECKAESEQQTVRRRLGL